MTPFHCDLSPLFPRRPNEWWKLIGDGLYEDVIPLLTFVPKQEEEAEEEAEEEEEVLRSKKRRRRLHVFISFLKNANGFEASRDYRYFAPRDLLARARQTSERRARKIESFLSQFDEAQPKLLAAICRHEIKID